MWGGLLLGWAREGRPLEHDLNDADFAFLAEDLPSFPAAADALIAAGFAPLFRFVNNDGRPTEYSFTRNGAKFEFFIAEPEGAHLLTHVFAPGMPGGGPPVQALTRIDLQSLTTFEFLDRSWRKQDDHEHELAELYGDWRTPDSSWWYLDSPAIIDQRVWLADDFAWDGRLGRRDGNQAAGPAGGMVS
jgi:hypothetical protein